MKNFFLSFQVKFTLALILSMLTVLLLSHVLIYKYSFDAHFQNLRERMRTIAQSAALLIDAPTLMAVPLNQEGIHSPSFKSIQNKLRQFKSISDEIAYVYTLRKTNTPGLWQFVVDADPLTKEDIKVGRSSLPGAHYDASRFPAMLQGFDVASVDEQLEVDEWGATLSGYAPIRDASGKTVAVIGVDMAADDVYQIKLAVQRRVMMIFFISIVMAVLIGMFVSRRMTAPINTLVRGTRRIAAGDYTYKVYVDVNDEFKELAKAFNYMANSIDDARKQLLNHFYAAAQSLVRVLEARDEYTEGHSEAVADYCARVAKKMGYSEETVEFFRVVAVLHDIGKVGVRDQVLNKPGPLTAEELEEIKQHTIIGENILKPILADNAKMLEVVRNHHERYDGQGYPDQLGSDKISIFTAIVTVCDAYHAMTSDRVYRKKRSQKDAIVELKRHSGAQFHPKVVKVFLEILKNEKK